MFTILFVENIKDIIEGVLINVIAYFTIKWLDESDDKKSK